MDDEFYVKFGMEAVLVESSPSSEVCRECNGKGGVTYYIVYYKYTKSLCESCDGTGEHKFGEHKYSWER